MIDNENNQFAARPANEKPEIKTIESNYWSASRLTGNHTEQIN